MVASHCAPTAGGRGHNCLDHIWDLHRSGYGQRDAVGSLDGAAVFVVACEHCHDDASRVNNLVSCRTNAQRVKRGDLEDARRCWADGACCSWFANPCVTRGQTERVARGSPILASRKSKSSRSLLTEKLQFAADRPVEPGLLETLYCDTCKADAGKNLWVRGDYRTITSLAKDALIRSGVAESWSVVPPLRGRPVTYFATAGTGLTVTAPPVFLPLGSREETPRGSTPQSSGAPHRSPTPFDSGAASVVHQDAFEDSEFVVVDCFPHIICPLSYALCSTHPFHAGDCPRNWVFEGSADHGTTWVTLRAHVNDASIGNGCDFAMFDIPPISIARQATFASTSTFPSMELKRDGSLKATDTATIDAPVRFCGSMFRIRLTGPNAAGTTSLQVGALELYGRALVRGQVRAVDTSATAHEDEAEEDITSAVVFGCEDPVVPSCFKKLANFSGMTPLSSLPPPPVAA
ncbi:Hypothetical protein, putative, partial [Bodo saltans]